MFSLSFFFRSPSLILKSTAIKLLITDQAVSSFYVCHCSMVWRPHQSIVCHRSTSLFGILIALSPHRSCNHRSRHADLGFVGWCRWWVWDVGLCQSLWLCFFFFFLEVALVDVGLCWWWLLVLLRQWWLCCWCCCC